MTLVLKQLVGLIRLLHSETGTASIASGIAAGFVLGLSPGFSLQTILIWAIVICFRVQAGAAGLAALVFGIFAIPFHGLFDLVGTAVLSNESLRSLWTSLYHMPIIPLTKFNNSIVMGAGLVALVLSPLVYWGAGQAITRYRVTVVARLKTTRAWKWFSATKLVQWYLSVEQYR